MKLNLPIPSYSTLSRRAAGLAVEIIKYCKKADAGSLHAVLDSTGLKVFGEGEWKVRQHGYSKRRTWRKLHLCVDEKTGKILSSVLTKNSVRDSEVFEDLIGGTKSSSEIFHVSADGAYDAENVYQHCDQNNIQATIPPQKNAKIKKHGTPSICHIKEMRISV